MADNPDPKRRINKERRRLEELIRGTSISPERIQTLIPVIENVAWMKVKLEEIRTAIKDEEIIVEYDNGGGQTGTRENPAFKGYENLWKAYMLGVSKIIEHLPEKEQKRESENAQNVLSLIMDRRKKEA